MSMGAVWPFLAVLLLFAAGVTGIDFFVRWRRRRAVRRELEQLNAWRIRERCR